MKPVISLILLFFIAFDSPKTNDNLTMEDITVCHAPSATDLFAEFVKDPAFVNSHVTPRSINFQNQNGQEIQFTTSGEKGNGYLIKSATPTDKYLFVIHEWWGLNDQIKEQTAKLYKDLGNINVLAIDLYDGQVTDDPKKAGQLMGGVKSARAEAIIKGAMAYAGSSAEIYTIGWCFGGGWSLQASILLGDQAKGAVMYYGMPEKDLEKLKSLKVDVLGIWATERWINADVIAGFEKSMKEANKNLISHQYKSNHAFANPSQPSYNEADAKDAYQKTIAFLKERID